MTTTQEDEARLEAKAAWSVVVVYEDSAACERAVGFCDQLVNRFWAGFEFKLSWWSFVQLEEAESAAAAAGKAALADLVVFAANAGDDFSPLVKAWIETWLNLRGEREGVLVGLLEPSGAASSGEGQKDHVLRNAAHHGGMDYLTEVPQDISRAIPDSLDSYTERADQVTGLLATILRQRPPPPSILT
jgi:hypothetical protein